MGFLLPFYFLMGLVVRFGLTMNKVLPLIFLNVLLFGQEIIEFKTGTSFGMCLGYCLSQLTITANDTDYFLYGWDKDDPVFQPVAINDTVEIFQLHFRLETCAYNSNIIYDFGR